MTLGGDYLSPSAIGTAIVDGQPLAGRQMVDVLNHVGVDWAVLGNHEFDVSEAAFRARLAESRFRVVAEQCIRRERPAIRGNGALRDRARPGRRTNDSAGNHRPDDRFEPASVGAVCAAGRRGARAARAAAGQGRCGDRAHASLAGGRSGPRHPGAGHRPRPRRTRTRELASAPRTELHADRESRCERAHCRDRDADVRPREHAARRWRRDSTCSTRTFGRTRKFRALSRSGRRSRSTHFARADSNRRVSSRRSPSRWMAANRPCEISRAG